MFFSSFVSFWILQFFIFYSDIQFLVICSICYTCNIFWCLISSLAFDISLLYVHIHCNCFIKHLGFLFLSRFSLILSIFIDVPFPLYIMPIFVLYSCQLFVDSYSCLTEVIVIFYSLSVSSTTIGGYLSIILIMSVQMFFFSRNIVYMSSIFTFMANILNLIIKSAICFLLCLNISIFYLASATLLLSLKIVLISLINSF